MDSFSRQTFERTFGLFRKHPWLKEDKHSEDAFWELVDALCGTPEEKQVVYDLLDRFVYLTYPDLKTRLDNIVNQMFSTWGLTVENTQIVASHQATDPDSSQFILQLLKPHLKKAGIEKPRLVNNLSKVKDYLPDKRNIVIIDEFSGTGKTLLNRIDDVRTRCASALQNRKIENNISIYVCLVAAMERAIQRINKRDVTLHVEIPLKKGLSGYLSGIALRQACKQMLRIENKLADEVAGERLETFGYGRSQALYALEGGNIPNNVFPIFWWPELLNKQPRKTLFQRLP